MLFFTYAQNNHVKGCQNTLALGCVGEYVHGEKQRGGIGIGSLALSFNSSFAAGNLWLK